MPGVFANVSSAWKDPATSGMHGTLMLFLAVALAYVVYTAIKASSERAADKKKLLIAEMVLVLIACVSAFAVTELIFRATGTDLTDLEDSYHMYDVKTCIICLIIALPLGVGMASVLSAAAEEEMVLRLVMGIFLIPLIEGLAAAATFAFVSIVWCFVAGIYSILLVPIFIIIGSLFAAGTGGLIIILIPRR